METRQKPASFCDTPEGVESSQTVLRTPQPLGWFGLLSKGVGFNVLLSVLLASQHTSTDAGHIGSSSLNRISITPNPSKEPSSVELFVDGLHL